MGKRKSSAPTRRHTPTKTRCSTRPFQLGRKLYKLYTTTINDIKKLQSSTHLCIPKLPFSRLIREILMENTDVTMKVQSKALSVLQEAAEIYLTQLFEQGNRCAYHANRITLKPIDLQLALSIRGVEDPGYLSRY